MSILHRVRRTISASLKASEQPRTRPARFKSPLPGFDELYYRYWYRDITSEVDALDHYLAIGWREGRDPSDGFSTRGYLAANRDVAIAKMNPLVHFLDYGIGEGREGWQKPPGRPAPAPTAPLDDDVKLLAPPTAPVDQQTGAAG